MKKQKQKEQSEKRSKDYVIVCIDRENYDLFDIRSNKPIFFYNDPLEVNEDDFDHTGSGVFQEVDEVNIQGKDNKRGTIQYFAPNSVGILLSTAQKALFQAKRLLDEEISVTKLEARYTSNDKLKAIQDNSRCLYDYIEFIQTGIVFGYTALETFVNLSIPDDYQYSSKNTKGMAVGRRH